MKVIFKEQTGQATMILTIVILFIGLLITSSFIFLGLRTAAATRNLDYSVKSYYVAEGGIEDLLLRSRTIALQMPASYPSILTVGTGSASRTYSSPPGGPQTFTSEGDVSNRIRELTLLVSSSVAGIGFPYGVQVGDMGLEMKNNSSVQGNVFSNGSITGTGNQRADITGDAFIARNTPTIEDDQICDDPEFDEEYEFGRSDPVEDVAQRFTPTINEMIHSVWLYARRVGNPNDPVVRIVTDNSGEPSANAIQSVTVDSSDFSTTLGWVQVSFGSTIPLTAGVPYWLVIDARTSSSRYFFWGSDTDNCFVPDGGVYSHDWDNSTPVWTNAGRDFIFSVWLGGTQHQLDNIDLGGDVDAPTISDCDITGDASYDTNNGCTVTGSETSPTSPIDPLSFPIDDTLINGWKNEAESGGTINGDYAPDTDSTNYLGPIKITGDFITDNNQIIIITGTIWVEGDILIDNGTTIKLDPGYGEMSGLLMSDGSIHIRNNGTFQGSGQAASYLVMLSTLPCVGISGVGCGHHNAAIDLHNNAEGTIFYARDGLIFVHNGVEVSELTARKIELEENAELIYDSGLADALFSGGPTGGQSFLWEETY